MVFMILVQLRDCTPSVYLISQELRQARRERRNEGKAPHGKFSLTLFPNSTSLFPAPTASSAVKNFPFTCYLQAHSRGSAPLLSFLLGPQHYDSMLCRIKRTLPFRENALANSATIYITLSSGSSSGPYLYGLPTINTKALLAMGTGSIVAHRVTRGHRTHLSHSLMGSSEATGMALIMVTFLL